MFFHLLPNPPRTLLPDLLEKNRYTKYNTNPKKRIIMSILTILAKLQYIEVSLLSQRIVVPNIPNTPVPPIPPPLMTGILPLPFPIIYILYIFIPFHLLIAELYIIKGDLSVKRCIENLYKITPI